MAALTWSGDDGFDEAGRRVARVLRWSDSVLGEPLARRYVWEAFVASDGAFEPVMVDGGRGRWSSREDAMAAADAAYRALMAARSEPFPGAATGRRRSGAGVRGPVDEPDTPVRGVLGHVRSLWRAWRKVYRDERRPRGRRSSPDPLQ